MDDPTYGSKTEDQLGQLESPFGRSFKVKTTHMLDQFVVFEVKNTKQFQRRRIEITSRSCLKFTNDLVGARSTCHTGNAEPSLQLTPEKPYLSVMGVFGYVGHLY